MATKVSAGVLDVLGTVSQSGGVPTGAIIERGSNANGEYVRYADGTQICTMLFSISVTADVSYSRTLPSSPIGEYAVIGSTRPTTNHYPVITCWVDGESLVFRSTVTTDQVFRFLFVGRWF